MKTLDKVYCWTLNKHFLLQSMNTVVVTRLQKLKSFKKVNSLSFWHQSRVHWLNSGSTSNLKNIDLFATVFDLLIIVDWKSVQNAKFESENNAKAKTKFCKSFLLWSSVVSGNLDGISSTVVKNLLRFPLFYDLSFIAFQLIYLIALCCLLWFWSPTTSPYDVKHRESFGTSWRGSKWMEGWER